MKKKLYFLLFSLISSLLSYAAHIVGGEMIYRYLGPSPTAGSKRYEITLYLFRDQLCTNCAQMPDNVFIGIFNNDSRTQISSGSGTPYFNVQKSSEQQIPVTGLPPCVTRAPDLVYHVASYTFTVDLPENKSGYTAAYQTCCRVNPLANVFNTSSGSGGTGSTYSAILPGTDYVAANDKNSSPKFFLGISVICHQKPFTLDFSAQDEDGDSLVYSFAPAYGSGSVQNSTNINPAAPPYNSVPYVGGFTESTPLGGRASIDPKTGIISGVAPAQGKYVVCVSIDEYRRGKLIGIHRKDFIVNVADCDFAGAQLQPSYITCDGFSYTFENLNNSPLNKTFNWDFGVPGRTDDVSTSANPSFTYPDTGTYTITLVVNQGEACGDRTTSVIRVYPGFIPDFNFTGICFNKPTQFTDATQAVYGNVNSWSWDFGDPATTTHVSDIRNPTYTYGKTGTYQVRLIATSTKGCVDTVIKAVNIIDKPPIAFAFKDTLICNGDQLQLQAIGSGQFSWSPTTNMTNANTATPTVQPPVTTKYVVELDDSGCKNKDSMQVRVVNAVTLQAMNDTTICAGDMVQLRASGNGLKYSWSPPQDFSNPNVANPTARPVATTTYKVTAHIGGCAATDDVAVTLVPYPVARAGNDTLICFGTQAQLNGQMTGRTFTWSPAGSLSNPASLTPIASPRSTTAYVLTVTDVLGCPKAVRDTAVVTVLPKVNAFAGRDTAVIAGQPLQLKASGGTNYLWLPSTGLSNPKISDPVAQYDGSDDMVQYKVLVSDENGCLDSASLIVRVFKTDPRIFVPTAFTPNGDGRNDVVRPIAVGIAKLEYFRIYNRWGQLVFSTSVNGQGWDGRINGQLQGSATFVWLVKGVDFLGKEVFAKGTVTLIR
ncbi:MAG: PKD domain-containing protein [Bacteroidota bacterium]|nr:PKD domain-containing protein [Bacteroidota bacterium]